jgi:hypothetical protein
MENARRYIPLRPENQVRHFRFEYRRLMSIRTAHHDFHGEFGPILVIERAQLEFRDIDNDRTLLKSLDAFHEPAFPDTLENNTRWKIPGFDQQLRKLRGRRVSLARFYRCCNRRKLAGIVVFRKAPVNQQHSHGAVITSERWFEALQSGPGNGESTSLSRIEADKSYRLCSTSNPACSSPGFTRPE